jgi:hypothetical protein
LAGRTWCTRLDVTFFTRDDSAFWLVASDGERIPRGVPVEKLRRELGRRAGLFKGPDGRHWPIRIPAHVTDGAGFYVNVAFTRRKPGTVVPWPPVSARR